MVWNYVLRPYNYNRRSNDIKDNTTKVSTVCVNRHYNQKYSNNLTNNPKLPQQVPLVWLDVNFSVVSQVIIFKYIQASVI